MGIQKSDVEVKGIAHPARTNLPVLWRRFFDRLFTLPVLRKRVRISQCHTTWKICAMATIGWVIATPYAYCAMGTTQELVDGFNACKARGDLASRSATSWGGTCKITLSANPANWSPTNSYPKTNYFEDSGAPERLVDLIATDMGTNQSASITFNNDVRYQCPQQSSVGSFDTNGKTVTAGSNVAIVALVACSKFVTGNQPPIAHSADTNVQEYTSGLGTYGSINLVNNPTGVLTLVVDVAPGTAYRFPQLYLGFRFPGPPRFVATVGVGTSSDIDPNPAQPPVSGDKPNCTAITGISTSTYDFGNGTAGKTSGKLTTSNSIGPHQLSISCSAGSYGSIGANATLYVQSNQTKNPDSTVLLASASDWIGLSLGLTATPPSGITIDNSQASGTKVRWNGASPTPLWSWSIPARSVQGAITLPAVPLDVQINQLQATPGKQEGTRTYQITYSTVIQ